MIDGLDKAVLSMKKKEHALVTISPEYGFGAEETKRDLAVVPANSKLVYEIELVEFVKVKEIHFFFSFLTIKTQRGAPLNLEKPISC